MRLITTHVSADFDAFAAALCTVRLFPGYRILFPGSLEVTVRRFLAETALPYPEIKLKDARRALLEHVVVVDTQSPRRLGEVRKLIEKSACRVTVIDHHVTEGNTLGAETVHARPVGAACTVVSSLMREQGIEATPEEASLMLMGIYEDTGGLSFRDTTPEDLREAAILLEKGGTLQWVRRWILKGLEPEQLALLNRLVEGAEEFRIRDVPVAITMVEVDQYHEEAAYVVHRWMEIFKTPIGAAILVRPPHVSLILRSRLPEADVGRIAEFFGGGGHPTAASATVSGRMPVELREELLAQIEDQLPPPARAIDVANMKIFSVESTATVRETKSMLNRLRVNALPVQGESDDDLVGTVTRQGLDNALSHRLGDRPVAAVMQPGVPMAPAETALTDLKDDFLSGSHRFVIVTEGGAPVGLITRMELFRHLFVRQSSIGSSLDRRMAGTRPLRQNVVRLLRSSVPPWVSQVLEDTRAVAAECGASVYMVGGMVRDLLLGRSNEDLDLVVEGNGIEFAKALAERVGARCHPHEPFLTAVLTMEDGHSVDVVSARTEFYQTPAALPDVITSLIRQDLFRRDFTINALAIALHGDRYGELIDFFGGRKDLDRQEIRVLHSLSFIDDPTRAIRAVRYARRLGFTIAPDTRNLITTAVAEHVFDYLSGQRLLRELELLLSEAHPTPALGLLGELGLLGAISPGLEWSEELRSFLLEVEGQLAWFRLERVGPDPVLWLLFLGGLASVLGEEAAAALAQRLCLSGDLEIKLLSLPTGLAELRSAAAAGLRTSELIHQLQRYSDEVLLLAMAGLKIDERLILAGAATAAARTAHPVGGAQLIERGIKPGPWIGRALRTTWDALVDGDLAVVEALDFAVHQAQVEQARTPPSKGAGS